MGFSSFIAKKYYHSKSKWNIVNIISRSASFVLVIAVCSFFVVLSVFSGLKTFGDNYTKAFDPEIKITSNNNKFLLTNETNETKIKNIKGVSKYSKIIEEKVLVQNEENNGFANLHGVDSFYNSVVEIDSIISIGKWLSPGSENKEAVVSYNLADNLDLGLFNYGGGLSILVPSKKQKNNLFKKSFSSSFHMVSGVFNSSDVSDQKTLFTTLNSAQKLLGLNEKMFSAIAVKTNVNSNVVEVANQIKKVLGKEYTVKTRRELNETYYKMLNAESLILNFVLGLILIVAMFNTIGAVIILIIEKKRDIQTLYKIGANESQITKVFFKHGLYLSYSGGFIGLVLGCLIVFLQEQFNLILLSGTSIPYPVTFDFNNFLIVIGWLLVVGAGGSFVSSIALKKIKL